MSNFDSEKEILEVLKKAEERDNIHKEILHKLKLLEEHGFAKYIIWYDGYDVHGSYVISLDKHLLSNISIDGTTINNDYILTKTSEETSEEEIIYIPSTDPRLVRITI